MERKSPRRRIVCVVSAVDFSAGGPMEHSDAPSGDIHIRPKDPGTDPTGHPDRKTAP